MKRKKKKRHQHTKPVHPHTAAFQSTCLHILLTSGWTSVQLIHIYTHMHICIYVYTHTHTTQKSRGPLLWEPDPQSETYRPCRSAAWWAWACPQGRRPCTAAPPSEEGRAGRAAGTRPGRLTSGWGSHASYDGLCSSGTKPENQKQVRKVREGNQESGRNIKIQLQGHMTGSTGQTNLSVLFLHFPAMITDLQFLLIPQWRSNLKCYFYIKHIQ